MATPPKSKEFSSAEPKTPRKTAFEPLGFKPTLKVLADEIRELYLADTVPWIIGYSGGKDSTATLQLIWKAVLEVPEEKRIKPIHVISTDTLVENPIVSSWVARSLQEMREQARAQRMPIQPLLLRPRVEETFWVNLIGRGYPAPRHKFRWCTERLKIKPSNRFISDVVTENGEAILCLGARKAESQARAKVLEKNTKFRVRDRLSPSGKLPGCMIYTPVEDWSNDDVWFYLMQESNPWGHSNRDLLGMYAGASADGECPLVVDDSTPSCGDSRFGCWVCTMVEKDKSMTAMIQNDQEKEWMLPLLELRNALDFRSMGQGGDDDSLDHHLRDFRRMTGSITMMANGQKSVPGPYTQEARETWLKKLLEAQTWIRKNGPKDVKNIELITIDELQEIRRIWVVDKHELEDRLPVIYKSVTGNDFPGVSVDDSMVLGSEEMAILNDLCKDDRLHYELARELLSVTRQQKTTGRRSNLFDQLEKTFSKHFFENKADALDRARRVQVEKGRINQRVDGSSYSSLAADEKGGKKA